MLSIVDSAGFREKLGQWYKALNARRIDELAALLDETADENMLLEYPQSGERIKGRENNLAILENYPGLPDATVEAVRGADDKWVLTPSWTALRITGTGDHYSVEGRVTYPNGETWNYVGLFELRSGKVVKLTEYYAAPFPAAEWRAKWVEKTERSSR